ncbi:Uncharacterised protein [Mycobacterium tuberculosis]|nr:Uncharacterised protein [Mycobacterium tuberculosis]
MDGVVDAAGEPRFAVRPPDLGVQQPFGQFAADAEEHLVVVGGAALADVEDEVVEGGVAGAQLGGGAEGQLVDGEVLAAEPPLPGQPVGQEPNEGMVGRRHGYITPSPGASSGGGGSRNQ